MATSRAESESIERTLQRLEQPWMQAGKTSTPRLLRLSLLRELTRVIHTLRSECMATDRATQADDLARREHYLNTYFPVIDLSNLGLAQAYSQTSRAAKPVSQAPQEVALPAPVIDAFGATKFTRQDRKWENEIAQEAVRQDWEFWVFEASTEIHQVESFARQFTDSLWPQGVVLFVESDGFLKISKEDPNLAHWRGRWLVVLKPHALKPEPTGIQPSWNRLHPAKKQS